MNNRHVLTTHQILSVICQGFNARITHVDSTCYHVATSPAQLEHLRDRINSSALPVTNVLATAIAQSKTRANVAFLLACKEALTGAESNELDERIAAMAVRIHNTTGVPMEAATIQSVNEWADTLRKGLGR